MPNLFHASRNPLSLYDLRAINHQGDFAASTISIVIHAGRRSVSTYGLLKKQRVPQSYGAQHRPPFFKRRELHGSLQRDRPPLYESPENLEIQTAITEWTVAGCGEKGQQEIRVTRQQGPYVSALQKALNRLRTTGYGWIYPTGAKVYPSWGLVSEKGEFDQKTYTSLKGFQDWANRFNRAIAHDVGIKYGGAPRTRAYKKEYYGVRERIKPDGIAGPVTLTALDEVLGRFRYNEKREGKR